MKKIIIIRKRKKLKNNVSTELDWSATKQLLSKCFDKHTTNLKRTCNNRFSNDKSKEWYTKIEIGFDSLKEAMDNSSMQKLSVQKSGNVAFQKELFMMRYLKLTSNKFTFDYKTNGILCNLLRHHPLKLDFDNMSDVDVQLAITLEVYIYLVFCKNVDDKNNERITKLINFPMSNLLWLSKILNNEGEVWTKRKKVKWCFHPDKHIKSFREFMKKIFQRVNGKGVNFPRNNNYGKELKEKTQQKENAYDRLVQSSTFKDGINNLWKVVIKEIENQTINLVDEALVLVNNNNCEGENSNYHYEPNYEDDNIYNDSVCDDSSESLVQGIKSDVEDDSDYVKNGSDSDYSESDVNKEKYNDVQEKGTQVSAKKGKKRGSGQVNRDDKSCKRSKKIESKY